MNRGTSTIRTIVAVVVVLGGALGGAYVAGIVGMPSVTGVENRFAAVDDETTTIESELMVENPNVFSIGLGGVTVNYTVELNEVRFAQGTKEGVNLSAGNATLDFRTVMSNERIPEWWANHIRDGESSDLVVHARVHSSTFDRDVSLTPVDREMSTDLLSAFASDDPRPVDAEQPFVSDPVLYVNETSARWGSVSDAETPIEMTFVVYNPKNTPYAISSIGYDITMNEVPVGSGELEEGATIPPKEERTIEAVTTIQNEELDEWWVTHIERDQVTDLRIDFYAELDLGGDQTVRVPLDELTYTETMETDVFGNENETDAPVTETPGDDGTSDGAETGTEEESTSVTTATSTTTVATTEEPSPDAPTSTPTTEETETVDGGLL